MNSEHICAVIHFYCSEDLFIFVVQVLISAMLLNMTSFLVSIAAKGNVANVPYIEIAERNLVFAWGNQLKASAFEGRKLSSSSTLSQTNVSHIILFLNSIAQSCHLNLSVFCELEGF